MLADHAKDTIARKEWRARRGVWLACLLASVAAALVTFASGTQYPALLPLASCCVTLVLGAGWISNEEHDPARAWIETLPIARSALLRRKLVALLWQWLPLMLVCAVGLIMLSLLGEPGSRLSTDTRQFIGQQAAVLIGCLPLLLLTALIQLHARSPIVTIAMAGIMLAPLGATLAMDMLTSAATNSQNSFDNTFDLEHVLGFALRCGVLSMVLVAWLWFVWTRTRLRELGAGARSGLMLLTMLGLGELSFLMFNTGWRDLWFILTGY